MNYVSMASCLAVLVLLVVFSSQIVNVQGLLTDLYKSENKNSLVQNPVKEKKSSSADRDILSKLQSTEIHQEPGSNRSKENFSDLITSSSRSLNTSLVSSVKNIWKGLNFYSAADSIDMRPINPPDITIGVSKNYVAQMAHNSIQVWDKTGKPIAKHSLYDFFNISRGNYLTDPEMIYDNSSGNWFSTIVDGGKIDWKNGLAYWSCKPDGCSVVLVKSNSDDPIQNRSSMRIKPVSPNFFPDQPKIAVSNSKVFMTTTEFNVTNENMNFFYTYMIDKNLSNFQVKQRLPQHFVIPEYVPSKCVSTVGLVKENKSDMNSNVSLLEIIDQCDPEDIVHIRGPESVSLTPQFKLITPSKFKQPLIDQPLVDDPELAITSSIRNGQSIWIALHSKCQPFPISNVSCVRILRLDNVTTETDYAYALRQNTQFNMINADLYYPAIGISKYGKFFFISGFSNSSAFPSVTINELVSMNQTSEVYRIIGSYVNNSTRYGDYFGSSIDPSDGSIWFSGEYVDQSISIPMPTQFKLKPWLRDQTWSTFIANVS